MASLNKVILIGNLGADPEVKFMTSGDAVCNLSLATTDSWRDKNSGEQRESTEWHRLTLYRRLAEIAGDYLKKGSQIYVEGRIKTRKWQDKDGNDRYSTDIEVNEMKMLGRREGGSSEQRQQPDDGDPFAPQQPAKQGNRSARTVADLDDDIPF